MRPIAANRARYVASSLSLSAGLFTERLRAPFTAVTIYKKWQDALRTRSPPAKEPQASSPSPKATTQTRGQPRCPHRSQVPSYETWSCNLKFTSPSHAERTTECALSSHEAPSGNKPADAKQQQPRRHLKSKSRQRRRRARASRRRHSRRRARTSSAPRAEPSAQNLRLELA